MVLILPTNPFGEGWKAARSEVRAQPDAADRVGSRVRHKCQSWLHLFYRPGVLWQQLLRVAHIIRRLPHCAEPGARTGPPPYYHL